MTDISKMDVKDLKALAYDTATSMQGLQQDLLVINQEIAKRQQQYRKEIKDDVALDIKETK